jgi:protein-S-isoprenylcysteine O-methyltransferase Ste14
MFKALSSLRLQKTARVAWRLVLQNAPLLPRMVGLHLDLEKPARGLAALAVFTLGLLWVCDPGLSLGAASAAFAGAVTLRFGFLFASFVPAGIAARFAARFGIERGYGAYRTVLDLLLFAQRASFLALVCATAEAPAGPLGVALMIVGALMLPLGVGVSVWATRTVGLDAWYYRDLFIGRRNAGLERRGPYAFCRDPMYLVGPLAGYGLALLALSPIALFAAGLNQALLLVFNDVVERPRLRVANSVFMETRYRYELAQSLLGFDPRTELARRVHSEPAATADAGPRAA